MHPAQAEIVVLKPTMVFLSFLAAQLPEADLPSLKLLQTDNTAYVIQKHDTDEATLDEIEAHYRRMFRHEICRWLGQDARNDIENSFLDFLCCFKFELHSHLIVMESSLRQGRQILCVKPRSVLLHWMKSAVEDQAELRDIMERVSLSLWTENATVLIKNFSTLADIKPFIQTYYHPLFETVMSRMSRETDKWPVVNSFQSFSRYFEIEIHTQLIHLQD